MPQAGKYRPEIYLNAQIRAGISTFAIEENLDEIQRGCRQLQEDIESGGIDKVITSYESDLVTMPLSCAINNQKDFLSAKSYERIQTLKITHLQ